MSKKYLKTKLSPIWLKTYELVTDTDEIAKILHDSHIKENYTALLINCIDDYLLQVYGTNDTPTAESYWDLLIND